PLDAVGGVDPLRAAGAEEERAQLRQEAGHRRTADEPAESAGQAEPARLRPEPAGSDLLEVVGLVEDHPAIGGEDAALEVALAVRGAAGLDRDVGEKEVVVDDDELGGGGGAPGPVVEAAGGVRGAGPGARGAVGL